MSNTPAGDAKAGQVPGAPGAPDRRRNAALRAMIDEMLSQVRELQQDNASWTPEERSKAEDELARIMARVRSSAVGRGDDPK